jgi:hypothetical protein
MANIRTMRIIWNPKNPKTKERGPTVQDWPDGLGKNQKYFADEISGEYFLDVPFDLGQHLLTEESPKWELISPEKVSCQARSGMGSYEMRTITADKNTIKKFEALFKEEKK